MNQARVPLPAGVRAIYTTGPALSRYWHADWVGSVRFISTASRGMSSDVAYAPYGEPYAQSGTPTLDFAQMPSDTYGDLYDPLLREYHYLQGRSISPDPAGLAAVDLTNPQSLNRYAYALNNPCSLTDPLGLDSCSIEVAFNGASALTGPQLSAAQYQINAILQAASNWLPQGDSVSASFQFGGNPDFTVNLTNASGTPVPYSPNYPLGRDFGSTADVYLNTVGANFSGYGVNPFSAAFGQVVGGVATHELGHYALGIGPSHTTDLGIMSRPPATTFNPLGYTYFGGFPSPFGQQFTPTQARGLFNFCQNKHGGSTVTGGGGTGNFPGNPGGQFQISQVVCWGGSEGGGCDVEYTWTTFPKQYK